MGVLEKFEPVVYAPLCMTSIMTLTVSLELVYVILTDPHLAPTPSVDRTSSSLEPEPWGTPHTVASPGQTLGMWQIIHLTFVAFVLGNVVGNLCLFIRRNPSIRGVFLANQAVGQGWSYCFLCESHVPPRCSHCPDCKVCVLRRDHHCVLFGQCVGHANHRFFLCCLLYMWLGLLYAISLNADIFLGYLQEGLSLHSLFLLFIPWAMLITDVDLTSEKMAPSTSPCTPSPPNARLPLKSPWTHRLPPVGFERNLPYLPPPHGPWTPQCLARSWMITVNLLPPPQEIS
ncbi:probable palmitoyltransferase ZDHHC24 isoform X2 [Mobula birostris]|uniref:probable palmitoyltransferase ZDHHC24 isoform X2 n=1 Tax=Mobula birostris TaxID=1983395 RepID=UPI003B27EE3D